MARHSQETKNPAGACFGVLPLSVGGVTAGRGTGPLFAVCLEPELDPGVDDGIPVLGRQPVVLRQPCVERDYSTCRFCRAELLILDCSPPTRDGVPLRPCSQHIYQQQNVGVVSGQVPTRCKEPQLVFRFNLMDSWDGHVRLMRRTFRAGRRTCGERPPSGTRRPRGTAARAGVARRRPPRPLSGTRAGR